MRYGFRSRNAARSASRVSAGTGSEPLAVITAIVART